MSVFDELDGMDDILDDFVVETLEFIEQLNEDLLLLEEGVEDSELVNRVFRAFHTIKGTSGFLNFQTCNSLMHVAENLLDQIRKGELMPNSQIIDALLDVVDWIKDFSDNVQRRDDNFGSIDTLLEMLKQAPNAGDGNEVPEVSAPQEVVSAPAPQEQESGTGEIIKITAPEELVDEFTSESSEHLETLGEDLLMLEKDPTNSDLINNIFRAFHTLKGNSGLLGVEQMSIVAHRAEDILNLYRDKKMSPNSESIDILLTALDWIKLFLDQVKDQALVKHDISGILEQLDIILGKSKAPAKKVEPPKAPVATPKPQQKSAKGGSPKKKSSSRIDQTIRVDVDRLDKLMNLAGELVLEKNRLLRVTKNLNAKYAGEKDVNDLEGVNNSMGFITTNIQEGIMQMRMLPIANVLRKFPRTVRDLAKSKGKKIELVIEGEETELDRTVIEAIGDPLVHLLRNAVDHGIETPEVRVAKGKPEFGTISLVTYQEGNHIVIEIGEDGAGIDAEKIKRIAIKKGVVSEDETTFMNEKEIINLIFKPGFSTAEKVTDVSGRGVGMDVVNSNIAKLNGSVDIQTKLGEGTTFLVKLPLTLTILSGMVVQIFNEIYIIPITSISETLKLEKSMISYVKGQEVIKLRNSVLPLVWMDTILGIEKDESQKDRYVVIVAVGDKRVGLIVTELHGQEETVVKPLGSAMGKVPHMAGATIRGDGRVNLIIDVPELVGSQFG